MAKEDIPEFVEVSPGDLIKSDDWNEIQRETRHSIRSHLHDRVDGEPVNDAATEDHALQIGPDEIAGLAVTGPKIAANAVTATKIAANAVNEAKIKDGAVTAAKLAEGVLQSAAGVFYDMATQWTQGTASSDYTPVIERQLVLETATSILVIGHGHGQVQSPEGQLHVGIRIDGEFLHPWADTPWEKSGAGGWGIIASEQSVPVVAIETAVLPPAEHVIELGIRSPDGVPAFFYGPILITILLGSAQPQT